MPPVNLKASDDEFSLEMVAPGFEKDDFKIDLKDNLLTISSEKKVENELKEGERYTRREFSYQAFSRSFTLPKMVDVEKISAKYDNGILNISIPKLEEAKPKAPKQIEIV
jgi:HSP20 family protein